MMHIVSEKLYGGKVGSSVCLSPTKCLINDWKGWAVPDNMKDTLSYPKEQIFVVIDHESPSGSIETAVQQKKLIDFADEHGLFLTQNAGIGYQLLMDKGLTEKDIVFCCGKHGLTMGATGALVVIVSPEEMAQVLEGKPIERTVPETLVIHLNGTIGNQSNIKDVALTIVSRYKNIIPNKLLVFKGNQLSASEKSILCGIVANASAAGAVFVSETQQADIIFDLVSVNPVVAMPGSNDLESPDALETVKLQGVFIGGCMSGRIEDLRYVAEKLKGKKVAYECRVVISPISDEVQIQAMDEGLIDILFDAGVHFLNPGCGSCKATSLGYMDSGEVVLSAGGCNYKGAGGSEEALVYMASLETAVESALSGYITRQSRRNV